MRDLTGRITGDQLTAANWNEVPRETQNAIKSGGLNLSGGDLDQLGKALAAYMTGVQGATDAGTPNDYILNSVGTFTVFPSYQDGLLLRFRADNTNTGVSTLNFAGLGTRTIVRESGSPLQAGDIGSDRDSYVRYDSASGKFLLALHSQAPPARNENFFPRNYIDGLGLSITTSEVRLSVDPGQCADDTNSQLLEQVSAGPGKKINADWVEGDDQGGFPSGLTRADATWYHFFIIAKPTGEVDAGYDSSVIATNLLSDATGYTRFRRLGAVLTNTSTTFENFKQAPGGVIHWNQSGGADAGVIEFNSTNPGDSTLTIPLTVPPDLMVVCDAAVVLFSNFLANEWVQLAHGSAVLPPAVNMDTFTFGDLHAKNEAIDNILSENHLSLRTNDAGQIAAKIYPGGNSSNFVLKIISHGWTDLRGRE